MVNYRLWRVKNWVLRERRPDSYQGIAFEGFKGFLDLFENDIIIKDELEEKEAALRKIDSDKRETER